MAQLPSELLSQVFSLACAERTHDIEQKLRLAQVCAYWRAVALDCPSFWAQIRAETSSDAAWLPMALARAGDSALDVELYWQHIDSDTSYSRTFSDEEEQAVVDALMSPEQRLRLKRLFVRPAAPILRFALLRAGSKFPALKDLEFHKDYEYLASIWDRLDAPSLRRLILPRLCLEFYDFLDTPSLELLSVRDAFDDEKDRLLTMILYRCTALRCLDWGVPGSSFMPTIIDETQRPLARLDTLRLADGVPFSDILRFIDRVTMEPLPDIAVTIGGGEAKYTPLVDLFSRMGALVDLHFDDTHEEIVIRDDVGHVRRLISSSRDPSLAWGMNDLWCTLARLYTIDRSLHSLRVRTNDWHGLAGGFASRAPTSLTEVTIVLRRGMQGTFRDLMREGHTNFQGIFPPPIRVLNLPSLRRLFIVKDRRSSVYERRWEEDGPRPGRDTTIPHMRAILQHIECDALSRVEVCVSVPELFDGRTLPQATQETLLDGLDDKWVLCSHCTGT